MIRKAQLSDAQTVAALANMLWPGHADGQLEAEFADFLSNDDVAAFLYEQDGTAMGFAQCGLRHDYVEGTDSSPVGYLEGIYVTEPHRHKGAGRMLLQACEDWTREKGCTEFASDCELDNTQSLAFHLACGFEEANRIICFTKPLGAVRPKP